MCFRSSSFVELAVNKPTVSGFVNSVHCTSLIIYGMWSTAVTLVRSYNNPKNRITAVPGFYDFCSAFCHCFVRNAHTKES